jgi:NAD(P)-dependent dehydrogenase (short-subunit alcohol dehydrogenase family)
VSTKKVIAVVGATGRQGGGLARAILADPLGDFTVRALTRNPESAPARRLANHGAEVVAADLNDEMSLRSAFDGAYGAFVVTDFFARRTAEQEAGQNPAQLEITQAGNAPRAAKAELLRHVIWSTAEDTRRHFASDPADVPRTMGGYAVPHLDAKAEANSLFTDLGGIKSGDSHLLAQSEWRTLFSTSPRTRNVC